MLTAVAFYCAIYSTKVHTHVCGASIGTSTHSFSSRSTLIMCLKDAAAHPRSSVWADVTCHGVLQAVQSSAQSRVAPPSEGCCCCAGEAPLDCPIIAFYGTKDRRITKAMVEAWQRFTTSDSEMIEIAGHHLWPLNKEAKVSWLKHICERLTELQA